MAELKKWGRNEPISANRLNEIQKSIYNLIQGGKGINVTTQGNKIILELSGNQRLPLNVLGDKLMVPFINDSGEEIPANSFVHITGVDADTLIVTCDKPDADSITADNLLIVTGAVPSLGPDGEAARSFGWPAELGKQWVAIESGGTEATNGDTFGTVSGEWYGGVDKTGFTALGGTEEAALVSPFRGAGGWGHELILDCPRKIETNISASQWGLAGSNSIDCESVELELENPIPVTLNNSPYGTMVGVPIDYYAMGFDSAAAALWEDVYLKLYVYDGADWHESANNYRIHRGDYTGALAQEHTWRLSETVTYTTGVPLPYKLFYFSGSDTIDITKIKFYMKGHVNNNYTTPTENVTAYIYHTGVFEYRLIADDEHNALPILYMSAPGVI